MIIIKLFHSHTPIYTQFMAETLFSSSQESPEDEAILNIAHAGVPKEIVVTISPSR